MMMVVWLFIYTSHYILSWLVGFLFLFSYTKHSICCGDSVRCECDVTVFCGNFFFLLEHKLKMPVRFYHYPTMTTLLLFVLMYHRGSQSIFIIISEVCYFFGSKYPLNWGESILVVIIFNNLRHRNLTSRQLQILV